MDNQLEQQWRVRQLVENWAVWRDAGLWDRFRTVWHDDGVMMATWFQGPFAEFIRVTREGWARDSVKQRIRTALARFFWKPFTSGARD